MSGTPMPVSRRAGALAVFLVSSSACCVACAVVAGILAGWRSVSGKFPSAALLVYHQHRAHAGDHLVRVPTCRANGNCNNQALGAQSSSASWARASEGRSCTTLDTSLWFVPYMMMPTAHQRPGTTWGRGISPGDRRVLFVPRQIIASV